MANVPLIVSPVEEIEFTWQACSSSRKYGLNGTVTRGWEDGCEISTDAQLTTSNTSTRIQNQRNR